MVAVTVPMTVSVAVTFMPMAVSMTLVSVGMPVSVPMTMRVPVCGVTAIGMHRLYHFLLYLLL